MYLLEIENLNKKYGSKTILEDINLKVKTGINLGLIGPTGCGKTTLLRLIDLLETPSSGKIIFDGHEISKKKRNLHIRRRMGMVFQKPLAFKGTVYDNVAYGLNIRGYDKEYIQNKVYQNLELLGMEDYAHQNASSLSGGESQRMALARVLVTEPDLVLLDEPTSNLDPLSREKIESLILQLKKERDTTIIMTTHDLVQGQRLSDEIAILNQKIFQIGKPEDVFRKPKNQFVADFVGVKNVIKGHARKEPQGLTLIKSGNIDIYSSEQIEGEVFVSIRPEDITLSCNKVKTSSLNEIKGKVVEIIDEGALIHLKIEAEKELFTVYMTRKSFLDMKINIGSELWMEFKATAVHLFQ
ncbi:ABC transporter ATP-binding protein [Methanobacterium alkalithermotolerans]|uniref:Molybdate/tungstate import ATP-binding protein WtpC n=1 Tax=Methanobacterium alkalithermotolerans TaxID=2731220 RepID=A0A8T8KDX4_9EURY|nr:ABC transporter ATP-binding protein [Methanobacterium alkalithermotolerans]QUH23551.1 ABC transporter ATP-binding protein [Methanobacterium alkalithermotolerans]RJS48670.1 MAG: tungsten ABC transporter ATP-binding protein [Methanobacterium sp.]